MGRRFRVIIAGGSIAGLTLALALEKNDIDFVVLEAYSEIAPQVGASLAVLPNGFRILDQLGCAEDILKKVNCTVDNFIIRDEDGKSLIHVKDLEHHLISRHGYPMAFFERRMGIEILYNRIRQKHCVLTNKRVAKFTETEDGVTVTCSDGETFDGDIVVGADGLHSAIGNQIRQMATEKNPEMEKDELPVQYRCLFGISHRVPGLHEDTLHHVSNTHSSSFASCGPNNRTYWCLFVRTPETYHGLSSIPPASEAAIAAQHADDHITETITFADLYARRITSVLTPLHEGVFRNWHTTRAIITGDAVHKFNPIVGLGGMSAIETVATLATNITALLKAHPAGIPAAAIEEMFAQTQAARAPRTAALSAASAAVQHRIAMETPLLRFMNRYYYPLLGPAGTLKLLSEAYPGAAKLGGEEAELAREKVRAHAMPFDDELCRVPRGRSGAVSAVVVAALVGVVAVGAWGMHGVASANGTFGLVKEAAGSKVGEVVGVPGLDRVLRSLVAAFLPVVGGEDADKLLAGYLLVGVVGPLLAVMVVESYRSRNAWSAVWSPSIWTGAAQLFGLGIFLPLYVLASFYQSSAPVYWLPAGRFVPQAAAKALLPAVLLGFLVPSVLMVMLDGAGEHIQKVIAFWQITPILVVVLTEVFSKLVSTKKPVSKQGKPLPEAYQGLDLPHLRRLYDALFVISIVVHLAVLAVHLGSPGLSLSDTFLPFDPSRIVGSAAEGMRIFFQFDLLCVLAATFIWSVLNVTDLNRSGISDTSVLKSVGMLVVGYVLVGPGASTVALWKWREGKMANPELKK